MSKELELFQELRYEYLKTIKDDKLDLIENAIEENEALKSQVVGLENIYEKLADKCDRLYKVVAIIKKKGVNLHILKMCDSVEEYNKLCNIALPLTQEEYDLLKEVLLWARGLIRYSIL